MPSLQVLSTQRHTQIEADSVLFIVETEEPCGIAYYCLWYLHIH